MDGSNAKQTCVSLSSLLDMCSQQITDVSSLEARASKAHLFPHILFNKPHVVDSWSRAAPQGPLVWCAVAEAAAIIHRSDVCCHNMCVLCVLCGPHKPELRAQHDAQVYGDLLNERRCAEMKPEPDADRSTMTTIKRIATSRIWVGHTLYVGADLVLNEYPTLVMR